MCAYVAEFSLRPTLTITEYLIDQDILRAKTYSFYLSLVIRDYLYLSKLSNNDIWLILLRLISKRQGTALTFYHIDYPLSWWAIDMLKFLCIHLTGYIKHFISTRQYCSSYGFNDEQNRRSAYFPVYLF